MSTRLVSLLSQPLDSEVRIHLGRVVESMWRDLEYLSHRDDTALSKALASGWSLERIRAIVVLNAFNRVVVGPFSAAYKTRLKSALGKTVGINYGTSVVVSAGTRAEIEPALDAFSQLAVSNGIQERWLRVTQVRDLVWALSSNDDDDDDVF